MKAALGQKQTFGVAGGIFFVVVLVFVAAGKPKFD
jgi:hypothetical protein